MEKSLKSLNSWFESENPSFEEFSDSFLKLPTNQRKAFSSSAMSLVYSFTHPGGEPMTMREAYRYKHFIQSVFRVAIHLHEERCLLKVK